MTGLAFLPAAVARVIHGEAFRAERRLRRYGYRASDLRQEFTLHWLKQRHHHNPRRSEPQTFASCVCHHRALSLLEAATAAKRGGQVWSFSEVPICDDHMFPIQRPEDVASDKADMQFGRRTKPAAELEDLERDVARVLGRLPSDLANLARLLAQGETLTDAATILGCSRATANRRLGQLRAAFAEAGLQDYFEKRHRSRRGGQDGGGR